MAMIYLYILILLLAVISGALILWSVPLLSQSADGKGHTTTLKPFSIIIPARNEEHNLPILLQSLREQDLQPTEILVIDDQSEDQTAAVAMAYGARVIQFQPDKSGWVGKSAACWAGANVAKGDWLLFLDADIFLPEKNSLTRIMTTYDNTGALGILSVQPFHMIESLYENLSVIFNIMVLAGMNRFSILAKRLSPAGAFGPSLLCDRKTYFEIGGHEQAKGSIMENVDLGRIFLEHGLPVRLFGGKGVLHFRMYPDGLHALSQGWSKSFASASVSTHSFILVGTSMWIAGAFLSFSFLLWSLMEGTGFSILLGVLSYLLYLAQFYRMARLAGNFHWTALCLYPLLFLYFVLLFIWSGIKTFVFRTVSWKGRDINV